VKRKIFSILFALVLMVSLGSAGVVANPAEQENPGSGPCSSCKPNCSSMAAGRLATVDDYTMSGHTCDGGCDWRLEVIPAAKHKPGDVVVIDYPGMPGGFEHDILGETVIPQVPETYKWFKCEVPLGNEHQVFIGENTCSTRSELQNIDYEDALLDWYWLPALGLQRGETAREVVEVIGALVEEYGLRGSAESYLVSDPLEAWILEIPGCTTEWVAQRVPDGHVHFHANRMRIGVIDLEDPDNFLASPNLITLAQERGFYDPEEGPFNFEQTYSSPSSRESMGNRLREWRMVSLLCPSVEWDPEAITYPFSVEPDELISVEWWINNVWRDSYEGTQFDLAQGNAAGPFGSPVRQSITGVSYARAIATQNTGYSWVSQSRSWLPDPIGGVVWYSMDSGRNSIYVPFYAGITETPESWRTGDYTYVSWDSAWWGFQIIDTISQIRYRDINADVREVFDAFEKEQFDAQADIEEQALVLYNRTKPQAKGKPFESKPCEHFLTSYSCDRAEQAEVVCEDMFYSLLVEYRDGRPRTTVSDEWREWLQWLPPWLTP